MSDQLVVNVMAINFSGRFTGKEAKNLGQAFLHHVVAAKDVGLVLGQQVRAFKDAVAVSMNWKDANTQN